MGTPRSLATYTATEPHILTDEPCKPNENNDEENFHNEYSRIIAPTHGFPIASGLWIASPYFCYAVGMRPFVESDVEIDACPHALPKVAIGSEPAVARGMVGT